jgi:hypothetical protein
MREAVMMLSPCKRELEVAELLAQGGWPNACAPELRAHVSTCRRCDELILVTLAFKKDRLEAIGVPTVASPGALWWRAQLRRRNEAVERVGKPILGAQIFALTTYVLIAIAFLAFQARNGIGWLTWLEEFPQVHALHLEALWPSAFLSSGWTLLLLIPLLATAALLSGVALYLASEKGIGSRE